MTIVPMTLHSFRHLGNRPNSFNTRENKKSSKMKHEKKRKNIELEATNRLQEHGESWNQIAIPYLTFCRCFQKYLRQKINFLEINLHLSQCYIPSIQGSVMLTSSYKCSSNYLDNFFPPDIFCSSLALDFWVHIFPLSDHKSLWLDLVLLKSF